jgi:hypothetical protein
MAVTERDSRIAHWLQALERLVPTPADRRERLLTPAEARATLGCGDDVLDALLDAGLPVAAVEDGEPRLDLHDVINVGLYSGSATSMPELAQRALLRFAVGDPATWTGHVTWSVAIEHHCPWGGGAAGHTGDWSLARPDVERWGGTVPEWSCQPHERLPLAPGQPGRPSADHASAIGRVRLPGRVASVRAAVVVERFREIVDGLRRHAPRFQWLSAPLRADPDAAARLGVADCGTTSVLLARELRGLGYAAHAREGHVLGLVPTQHAWVEVVDEDGVWKALDPVFAAIADRVPRTRPEFDAFCLGSFSNRVLPWDVAVGQPIATHRCSAGRAPVTTVQSGMVRP